MLAMVPTTPLNSMYTPYVARSCTEYGVHTRTDTENSVTGARPLSGWANIYYCLRILEAITYTLPAYIQIVLRTHSHRTRTVCPLDSRLAKLHVLYFNSASEYACTSSQYEATGLCWELPSIS